MLLFSRTSPRTYSSWFIPLACVLAPALSFALPRAIVAPNPVPAQAPAPAPSTADLRELSVRADSGLAPGSTLAFELRGRPGTQRTEIALTGSGVIIPLLERSPGVYAGTHVIRVGDRFDPNQLITARSWRSGIPEERTFLWPTEFTQAPAPIQSAAASALFIGRFSMRPLQRPEPGQEIRFRLDGNPGAEVWVDIPGVIENLDLQETRAGVYEGSYVVRRRDNTNAFEQSRATLTLRNQRTTASLDPRRDRTEARVPDQPFLQIDGPMRANWSGRSNYTIRGRAAPYTSVNVRVEPRALRGNNDDVSQRVINQNIQTDANGRFAFTLRRPTDAPPGVRFDVFITASDNGRESEEHVVLIRR